MPFSRSLIRAPLLCAPTGSSAAAPAIQGEWAATASGDGQPAARRLVLASLLAVAAIIAYGAVILAFPADSRALLVIDNLGSTLAALTSAALAFLAARRRAAGRARLSWQLLGLALTAWALGDGYWSWSEILVGVTPGAPSWADVGYFSMAVLIVAGAATHPIVRQQDISRLRLLLDILILLCALVAVAWSVALGPMFARLQTEPLTQAVTVVYPIGSLTALFLLIALLRQTPDVPLTTRLLASGLALTAAADLAYVLLAADDSYTTGHVVDWFWFSGAVLIGLAAVLDRPQPTPAPNHLQIGHPWQFLAPAALVVLAGVVVWLAAPTEHGGIPTVREASLALAGGLLVLRMAVGYRDAALIHQLHVERAEQAEAARVAREEAARLQGVILTGRELSHLLGNDLAITVGWVELLRSHPKLPSELAPLVDDASDGLERATDHLRRLQVVERIATHETPVGPALDLERSAGPALPTPSP